MKVRDTELEEKKTGDRTLENIGTYGAAEH